MIILDKPPGPVPSGSTLHGKTWNSRYDPDGSEDPTYHPFDTETKTFTSYVVAPQATINVHETKYRTFVLPIWTKNGVIVKTFSLSSEEKFLATITIESENSVLLGYYEDEDIGPDSILRIARVKV